MKLRLIGAVCACAFLLSLPANAARIEYGDLSGTRVLTTYDDQSFPFILSPSANIDGNTYTSDNERMRVSSFSGGCVNGQCIGTDANNGYIDIELGRPATQVGAYIGFNTNWSGTAAFFSNIGDTLLGTITFNDESTLQFAGWAHYAGIGRVRVTDTDDNGFIIVMDNFISTNATILEPVPIPPSLYLFGSGLIGLVGMMRRKATKRKPSR